MSTKTEKTSPAKSDYRSLRHADLTVTDVESVQVPGVAGYPLDLTHVTVVRQSPMLFERPMGEGKFDPTLLAMLLTADVRPSTDQEQYLAQSVEALGEEAATAVMKRIATLKDGLQDRRLIERIIKHMIPNMATALRRDTVYAYATHVRDAVTAHWGASEDISLRLTFSEILAAVMASAHTLASARGAIAYVETRPRRFASGYDLQVEAIRYALEEIFKTTDHRAYIEGEQTTGRMLANAVANACDKMAVALSGIDVPLRHLRMTLAIMRLRLTRKDDSLRELVARDVLQSPALTAFMSNLTMVRAAMDMDEAKVAQHVADDVLQLGYHLIGGGIADLKRMLDASVRYENMTLAEAASIYNVSHVDAGGTRLYTIVCTDERFAPLVRIGHESRNAEPGLKRMEIAERATSYAEALVAGALPNNFVNQMHDRFVATLASLPEQDPLTPGVATRVILHSMPAAERERAIECLVCAAAATVKVVEVDGLDSDGRARFEWEMALDARLMGGVYLQEGRFFTQRAESALVGVPARAATAYISYEREMAAVKLLSNNSFGANLFMTQTLPDAYEIKVATAQGKLSTSLPVASLLGVDSKQSFAAAIAPRGRQDVSTALANVFAFAEALSAEVERANFTREEAASTKTLLLSVLGARVLEEMSRAAASDTARGMARRAVFNLLEGVRDPKNRHTLLQLLNREDVRAVLMVRLTIYIAGVVQFLADGDDFQQDLQRFFDDTKATTQLFNLRLFNGGLK